LKLSFVIAPKEDGALERDPFLKLLYHFVLTSNVAEENRDIRA
jgi:hypothetical protein